MVRCRKCSSQTEVASQMICWGIVVGLVCSWILEGLVLPGLLPHAAEDLLSNLCSSSAQLPVMSMQSWHRDCSWIFYWVTNSLSNTTEPFCHRGMETSCQRHLQVFPPRFFKMFIITNTKPFSWASVGRLKNILYFTLKYIMCSAAIRG